MKKEYVILIVLIIGLGAYLGLKKTTGFIMNFPCRQRWTPVKQTGWK